MYEFFSENLQYNVNVVGYLFVDDYIPYKKEEDRGYRIENAVKATDTKAQYDESAKQLLGQKSILAHILVKTVDEFRRMNPKEVVFYIEGQPYISTVPVELGLTYTSSEKVVRRIVDFNSESCELNEGLV